MCFICRESVADLKRYNVKRHYDSKHKNCFDGAYVGKDERMKEFKKRYLGETKRVSVFTDTSSHLNEASYRICYLLAQHQCRSSVRWFSEQRLGNCHFQPTHVPVNVMS